MITRLAGRPGGCAPRPMLIAEIGNNHGGRRDLAEAMVRAAARSGADAVKFQTYRTDLFLSRRSAYFEEFEAERLGEEDQGALFSLAETLGLAALATPFDLQSLDFLLRSGRPAIKIASGDIDFFPLLRAVSASRRPTLLSTGACTPRDVEKALAVLDPDETRDVVLLHCTAAYPASPEDAHVRAMTDLARRFGRPVGLSDHTEGPEAALAAVALGAVVVEKHFTTDRSLPGGDNAMSVTPDGLADLSRAMRAVHAALGSDRKDLREVEAPLKPLIRRSPHALSDIRKGDRLTQANVALLRPGDGLPPETFDRLIGTLAVRDIPAGAPIPEEQAQ